MDVSYEISYLDLSSLSSHCLPYVCFGRTDQRTIEMISLPPGSVATSPTEFKI